MTRVVACGPVATLPFCHMSFTIEGTKSGRHLTTQTQCYKWSHLFMFAVAAVLLVVYGITKSTDLRDALGDVPALLPQVPSANFVVAYAAAYFMDFFLASLLCADFIVGALMLLRNRDGCVLLQEVRMLAVPLTWVWLVVAATWSETVR